MTLTDLKPGDLVAVIELSRGKEMFRGIQIIDKVTPKRINIYRGQYLRDTGKRVSFSNEFIRVPTEQDQENLRQIRDKHKENQDWHKAREEKQAQDAAFLNDFNFCGLLPETLTEIRALIQKDKDEVGW